MSTPGFMKIYRHAKSGSVYRAVLLGVLEATKEPAVVYNTDGEPTYWIRTISAWEAPNDDGSERFVQIF